MQKNSLSSIMLVATQNINKKGLSMFIIIGHDGASRQVTTEKIAELDQLGNIVKFVSAPDSIRKNRYKLQEKMQSLIKANTAFDEFKGLKNCMKVQISDVAIHHSVEHNKAFYEIGRAHV